MESMRLRLEKFWDLTQNFGVQKSNSNVKSSMAIYVKKQHP